jgi:TRAP-type C4-dicarboxylate transport system permease small subunit
MKRNVKIILIILGVVLISFLFFYFVKGATTTLENTYPEVGGEKITPETDLPHFVNYLFNFAFLAAGVLAFIFLIYGGFRYVTSAGNPTIMKDAKDQIISVLIGIAVLLGSYLILIKINPSFETIHVGKIEKVTGINLMDGTNNENALYYSRSASLVEEKFNFNNIEFINLKDELFSVFAFTEPYFQGTATEIKNDKMSTSTPCIKSISSNTKSIRFKWDLPGVYLKGDNLGEEIYLTGNISDLGRYYFKGKTKEIELKNEEDEDGEEITDFRAIIHGQRDYEGICQIFNITGGNEIPDFSSIKVFQKREEVSGVYPEIILYPLPNYQEYDGDGDEEMGKDPVEREIYPGEKIEPTKIDLEENVRSIVVPPGYLVVLFEKKPTGFLNPLAPTNTECQVFTKSNPDLTKELIGQCSGVSIVGTGQWNYTPCAKYIAIFAIE